MSSARKPPSGKPPAGSVEESRQRLRALSIAGIVALIFVGGAILISTSGDDEGGDGSTEEAVAIFEGIPQEGISLGDPDAPVVLTEFADPQCPFCAEFATEVLPDLVEQYVEPGDVRMELRLLTFIGPDSEAAARVALAAGDQGLMWDYMEAFYRNQGPENSGYATDEFLREIGAEVPDLDIDAAFEERQSEAITEQLTEAQSLAGELRVNSTPTFFSSVEGGKPEPLEVSSLEPDAFTEKLDPLVP